MLHWCSEMFFLICCRQFNSSGMTMWLGFISGTSSRDGALSLSTYVQQCPLWLELSREWSTDSHCLSCWAPIRLQGQNKMIRLSWSCLKKYSVSIHYNVKFYSGVSPSQMCHSLLDIMATFSTAFKELSLVLLTHKHNHNHINRWKENLKIINQQNRKVLKCWLPQPVSVPAWWSPAFLLHPPYPSCCLAASHMHHQPCFSARRMTSH